MVCLNDGFVKVIQKIILIFITAYLYTVFSTIIPSCPSHKVYWKIFPFDIKFFTSSVIFMASVTITIVECNIWLYNATPHNRLIKYLGEVCVRNYFK